MWLVEYADSAAHEVLRLDKGVRTRILNYFRERVMTHPDPKLLAEPLSGPLRRLWRFRIGDYRAICDIQGEKLVVLVLQVGHRSEIYK
jgi:mRNA interferase RelE/StbE